MDIITRQDLRDLIEEQAGWCISIYIPTIKGGKEAHQNPIRFKNQIKKVEEHLIETDMSLRETQKLLKPLQTLLQDDIFWSFQDDGLAVFLSSDTFSYYRLPLSFQDLVVVNYRFHLKPLLPLFSREGRFLILALSQKSIRLLQGTPLSITEVDLKAVPKNLAEALNYDQYKKQLQFYSGTPRATGKNGAIFYGAGIEDSKKNIHQYFQQINKRLHDLLREEHAPLILAGVEYLLPIYRAVNTYPHLVEKGITGNPDTLSVEELHKKGWPIVQSFLARAQDNAAQQYAELAGTKRASNNLKMVIPSAYHGRVDLLFVAIGIQKWGLFDADTDLVELHDKPMPDDEDLLDFAAIQTLLNRGTVYALTQEKIPENSPIAAVFRY
jgi:hypothetical protein